jgi:hypothetical protein
MPYSFITFLQARQMLAQRLYDAGMQYQPDDELGVWIVEALRTFNALANFTRDDFVFETVAKQTWYDITSDPMRAFNIKDEYWLIEILFHLLEPLNAPGKEVYPLTWAGSSQFTLSDVLNALQQSIQRTLADTGCTLYVSRVPAMPGRTFLNDSVLGLNRVCWMPGELTGYRLNCLLPSDLWATQSFAANFPERPPGTPKIYRRSTEPPISFDTYPEPAVVGEYEVLTVNAGATISLDGPSIMPIPDDWYWVTKYMALAQLFARESLAKDALRQDYCEKRWKQGVAFMQSAAAVMGARVNNVPASVDAIRNGDFYEANWQGKPQGKPRRVYYAGLNLFGLSPTPDDVYAVTVTTVRNMFDDLANFTDATFLQIGRDDIDPVLGLAQHIAMLKLGGAEFTATFPLLANFLRHCALYNSKLKAMSPWIEWLNRTQEEIRVNPLYNEPTPVTIDQQQGG